MSCIENCFQYLVGQALKIHFSSFIYGERIWGKITKLGISFTLDLPGSCRKWLF